MRRAFAAAWPDEQFVQQVAAQIPWHQNITLYAQHVYLLDPGTAVAPQPVPLAEFELAWLEKDYLYAVMENQEVQLL